MVDEAGNAPVLGRVADVVQPRQIDGQDLLVGDPFRAEAIVHVTDELAHLIRQAGGLEVPGFMENL